MISIARTLGDPETVPAGNPARSTSTAPSPSASRPFTSETRCITCEQRSTARHAPDVVPAEVHEHDVLGVLLRIRAQLGLEPLVGVGVGAAPPRPGDRPERHLAVLELD